MGREGRSEGDRDRDRDKKTEIVALRIEDSGRGPRRPCVCARVCMCARACIARGRATLCDNVILYIYIYI